MLSAPPGRGPAYLALSHQARRAVPDAILIAGGMEATFRPDRVFELGPPFDLVGLGEGEKALLQAYRLCDDFIEKDVAVAN